MSVYQVGQQVKEQFPVLEAYNMTMEAAVTKLMWVLGQTGTRRRSSGCLPAGAARFNSLTGKAG